MLVTGALWVMTTKAACTSLFSPAQTLTNAPKSTQTGKPRWNSADRFVRRAKKILPQRDVVHRCMVCKFLVALTRRDLWPKLKTLFLILRRQCPNTALRIAKVDCDLKSSQPVTLVTVAELVSRPGDFVNTNPLLRIGPSPAKRFC